MCHVCACIQCVCVCCVGREGYASDAIRDVMFSQGFHGTIIQQPGSTVCGVWAAAAAQCVVCSY